MNLYKLYPKYSSSCSPTWISEASRSMEYLTVDELLEKKMKYCSMNEFDKMKMKLMMAIARATSIATAADDDDVHWMNAEEEVSPSSLRRC